MISIIICPKVYISRCRLYKRLIKKSEQIEEVNAVSHLLIKYIFMKRYKYSLKSYVVRQSTQLFKRKKERKKV